MTNPRWTPHTSQYFPVSKTASECSSCSGSGYEPDGGTCPRCMGGGYVSDVDGQDAADRSEYASFAKDLIDGNAPDLSWMPKSSRQASNLDRMLDADIAGPIDVCVGCGGPCEPDGSYECNDCEQKASKEWDDYVDSMTEPSPLDAYDEGQPNYGFYSSRKTGADDDSTVCRICGASSEGDEGFDFENDFCSDCDLNYRDHFGSRKTADQAITFTCSKCGTVVDASHGVLQTFGLDPHCPKCGAEADYDDFSGGGLFDL